MAQNCRKLWQIVALKLFGRKTVANWLLSTAEQLRQIAGG